ncbi:amino acid adenylation domain-containing protein [Leptobacterium flavescens]|uniref:Amino acid adenylation domain-containing protein n=1 Tax=Leptobacterium flavescens TaxID=472055 RepID=A0A6P0UJY8_9FLAO|nr:amino acid adenylation domain-containing protein [Leptobacterium flavescens]NER13681.1 amino acid adenylation domain-containing protein [Leptobacterium flavescens]
MKKEEGSHIEKSSLLARWKNRSKKPETKGISKVADGVSIPLSYGQQRLWFLQQLFPKNPFYNYTELYRLKGKLNEEALLNSLKLVYEQHDILRSNYRLESGKTHIVINPDTDLDISRYDKSNLSPDEAEEAAMQIALKDSQTVFKLSEGSLLKASLIKLTEDDHILILSMHHIITDKWSMGVLRHQLSTYYRAFCNGDHPQSVKTEIQYRDYAYWQRKKGVDQPQLDYWKSKLAGDIPFLNLPTDFQRKIKPSFEGSFHEQHYSKEFSGELLELCKKIDATPYVVMLSVFYTLLFRYTEQEDLLIGTPISSRDQVALEDLIGFFNDTVVLRTKLSHNISFLDLVKSVKQTTLEAFSNKDVPFDILVKELNPERSLSINPFFQTMFLYHSVPEAESFGEELELSHSPLDGGVSKFDLTLYISENKGVLSSIFEYSTDLFESSTISLMHEHFKLLLEGILKDTNGPISGIPMLSEKEKELYTTSLDGVFAKNKGIHHYIEEQAKKHPQKTALVFGDKEISYEELNKKADTIAFSLMKKGVKRKDIIGLCIERSAEMVLGLLGILKAGAAYLPVDPAYPSERIDYILNDAKAYILLTQDSLLSSLESSHIQTFSIEECVDNKKANKKELPQTKDTDPAYVIYTSGSTGKPKGVPVSHRNIVNSTLSRTGFYGSDPESFLLMSSISFDSSKAGLFWTLCSGGCLVISEDRMEQDTDRIAEVISKHKVSHTLMLPSLYSTILSYGDPERLSSLTTVMVAGESCPASLVSEHFERLPQTALYNEYGPTEATVWCIAHRIREKDAKTSIPIGKAVANAEIYILNELLERVPYGAVGELYIGGIGLAKGYLHKPELSSQVFIPNPFEASSSERIYKTGDLVRYNSEGNIEFLGRKDQQVKVRGYRIELDEIEQHILRFESVEQAIVLIENNRKMPDPEKLGEHTTEDLVAILQKYLTEEEINDVLGAYENLDAEEKIAVLDRLS